MFNEIHASADRLAAEFRALGRWCTVAHSTNRDGGASSYLSVEGMGTQLRVSDHDSNWMTAWHVFDLNAERIIAQYEEDVRVNRARKAAMDAAVAAHDAERLAAREAAQAAKVAAEQSLKGRREAFFAAAGIDFAAARGPERQAARDAFDAACKRGEA